MIPLPITEPSWAESGVLEDQKHTRGIPNNSAVNFYSVLFFVQLIKAICIFKYVLVQNAFC